MAVSSSTEQLNNKQNNLCQSPHEIQSDRSVSPARDCLYEAVFCFRAQLLILPILLLSSHSPPSPKGCHTAGSAPLHPGSHQTPEESAICVRLRRKPTFFVLAL